MADNTKSIYIFGMSVFFVVFSERSDDVKIVEVLTNNVVIAVNNKNEDIIVMGSGLHFSVSIVIKLTKQKIVRIFRKKSTN